MIIGFSLGLATEERRSLLFPRPRSLQWLAVSCRQRNARKCGTARLNYSDLVLVPFSQPQCYAYSLVSRPGLCSSESESEQYRWIATFTYSVSLCSRRHTSRLASVAYFIQLFCFVCVLVLSPLIFFYVSWATQIFKLLHTFNIVNGYHADLMKIP